MDVFEVQIQYTQKRVVGGFTCKNDGYVLILWLKQRPSLQPMI